jgi:hypothetical protein
MPFAWNYPVYLIPLEGGYVSVVDAEQAEPRPHHLAVFTTAETAGSFMQHCQIWAEPRALRNAREFSWLLQSLRQPVTRVAFDPRADTPSVQCRWNVGVTELLQDHLQPDSSPWNYPVYVVRQPEGYASIEGRTPQGDRWTAVGLFSSRDKAAAYVSSSGIPGTTQELVDVRRTRGFLQSLSAAVNAVALDPVIDQGTHSAAHCFSLATLLNKYLTPR